MSSDVGATAPKDEALMVLENVARQNPNPELQKHALSLIREITVFRELKHWSNDIMSSNMNAASTAAALVNLRVIGSMAFKGRETVGSVRAVYAPTVDNQSSSSTIPDLMEFTPTDGTFDDRGMPQSSTLNHMSPNKSLSDVNHPTSPSPKRKSLTVRQATHLANIRRNSRDMGLEAGVESNSDSHLLGLLRKTLNVQDASSPRNTAPSPVLKEKKGPNWVKVGAWYVDLNDKENAGVTPFLRATNTIAKIMDSPGYSENLKAAEDEAKAKESDQTKHTPAAISALFSTNPALASSLWDLKDEGNVKSTELEASSGSKNVPTMQAAPKSRKSSQETSEIPEITVTEVSDQIQELVGSLGAGHSLDNLPRTPSILDSKPYQATLPLAPVPTHPQTFVYTPTIIPPGTASLYKSETETWEGEIEFDEFIPKFRAMIEKKRTSHTIPKTHDNPIVAAELALLHAQTILPNGCNTAFKEVCPCELSGRECPFKVTCSLKRCYHESEADYPPSLDLMHPQIRPSCVVWLNGNEDCGHTAEEKVDGEFGHDEKGTREWQGSDSRIRLHLAWNI